MQAAGYSDNNLHAVICQETGIVNFTDPVPKHSYEEHRDVEAKLHTS
jgi:hypothetical protein